MARVAVDVGLPHLDRPFDYEVPPELHDTVTVGCRVSVRFSGRLVAGFVLGLDESSSYTGTLRPLRRVVSAEPVLSEPVALLARTVADRYAGTLGDVLRLAVPPRHARVEREPPKQPPAEPPVDSGPGPSTTLPAGAVEGLLDGRLDAMVDRLRAGDAPRTAWTALPGDDWAAALAAACAACVQGGRGALVCLPDRRDVARVDPALAAALGPGQHVVLTAELGPAARYRAFLAIRRGQVRVVVGTRAAAFAPVRDPGLLVVWDDGDDLHAEPRAPYPHVREVLALRAHQEHTGLLLAGYARTPETQQLIESGWLAAVDSPRHAVRAAWPRVRVAAAPGQVGRLPPDAMRVVRAGLTRGPVLLQVPRAGYRPRLACQDCRTPAACPACAGPLAQAGAGRVPSCRWCGRVATDWACEACAGRRMRAPVIGSVRTTEEVGRALPGVPVRTSSGASVLGQVTGSVVVVATPGAEPDAPDGYAAGVLLDADLALTRPDLRAPDECLRRWVAVAAKVRPVGRDGELVVVGDPGSAVVQALVRADPAGFAERELAARRAARLPPASRLATVEGPLDVLETLTDRAAVTALTGSGWPEPADLLGPAPLADAGSDSRAAGSGRLVVRVPWASGPALARTLSALQAARSARKAEPLRVVVDPAELS